MTAIEVAPFAYQDICTLQARYWRFMDTKDWAGLLGVFAPDAHMSFPGERGGEAHGAEACVAHIRNTVETARTVHHGHNPEITFESPVRASAIWPMEDIVEWPDGEPYRGVAALHGWGHYHNRYVCLDDGWRISLTSLTRLRLEVTKA